MVRTTTAAAAAATTTTTAPPPQSSSPTPSAPPPSAAIWAGYCPKKCMFMVKGNAGSFQIRQQLKEHKFRWMKPPFVDRPGAWVRICLRINDHTDQLHQPAMWHTGNTYGTEFDSPEWCMEIVKQIASSAQMRVLDQHGHRWEVVPGIVPGNSQGARDDNTATTKQQARERPDVLATPTKKVRRELDTQPAATPTEPTRRKIAPDSATAKLLRRLEARRNAKKKSKA